MRIYDPRLGKFLSVDPLASKFPWWTPYQFAGNMPIKYIDLDGLEPAERGNEKGAIGIATIEGSENGDNYLWEWSGETWDNKGGSPSTEIVSFGDDVNKYKRNAATAWKNGNYEWWWQYSLQRIFGSAAEERKFCDEKLKPIATTVANINPLGAGTNSFFGYTDGTDMYGEDQSKTMATVNALGAVFSFVKIGGIFTNGSKTLQAGDEVFHATNNAEGLLKGINPNYFRTWMQGNRFGRGFYVGLESATAGAEAGGATSMVRYTVGYSPKLINLTSSGVSFMRYKPLSIGVSWVGKGLGYEGVLFNSFKNSGGTNMVLFKNFDKILTNGSLIK